MEHWDIYDNKRHIIAKGFERGGTLGKGEYHLVVHICLFRSDGKMLIQQRQPFKSGYGGMWDISVGGSALEGEDSHTAARRELKEELGVEADFDTVRPLLSNAFDNGYNDIFFLNRDIPLSELSLQPEEVADALYADKETVFKMMDEGSFIPYHKSFIALLFDIHKQVNSFGEPSGELFCAKKD